MAILSPTTIYLDYWLIKHVLLLLHHPHRAMLSICHSGAITVRDFSNTRGHGIATPNCIPVIVDTSVPIAKPPSQGGE